MKKSFFILLAIAVPDLVHAITVTNYTAATNDRFTNDPGFIGAAYDFSGVGRSTDTTSTRWATLIGSNYFISANHFYPTVGSSIQFHAGNSASGTSYTYTVAGGYQVGSTDFWIGYTENPIEASLARYGFSTTTANVLADTGLAGSAVFLSGDQIGGVAGSPTAHTVATNQIESFVNQGESTFLSGGGLTIDLGAAVTFDQIITFMNLAGDDTMNVTTYESQLASGDSGSPLFTTSGGELILQGLAYAIALNVQGNFIDTAGVAGSPQDPYENRDATFFAYTGSYATQINDTIALIPAPIPEPSVTALLATIGTLALLRRRR